MAKYLDALKLVPVVVKSVATDELVGVVEIAMFKNNCEFIKFQLEVDSYNLVKLVSAAVWVAVV